MKSNQTQLQGNQQQQQQQFQGQPLIYQGASMVQPQPIIQPQPFLQPQPVLQGNPQMNPQLNQIALAMTQNFSGFQMLELLPSVYIKQKFHLAEVFAGCDIENEYNIYATDPEGNKLGHHIFKGIEKSSCCQRSFELSIYLTNCINIFSAQLGAPFLKLQREYTCTCLCLDRPKINVFSGHSTVDTLLLGYIEDVFTWCDPTMKVYLAENGQFKLLYTIYAECCQMGLLCSGCPCQSCQEVTFQIKDASNNVVSTLQKKNSSCFNNCFTSADNFCLDFPSGSNHIQKSLLLAATIFIDYRYFEEDQKTNAL